MNTTTPAPAFTRLLRLAAPIILAASGVTFMVLLTRLLQNGSIPTFTLWDNAEVNFSFTVQMLMLPLTFIAIFLIHGYNNTGFRTFFTIRSRDKTEASTNWNTLGPVLALMFTAGTTMFMSFSVLAQHGQMNAAFFRLLPLVLLLAASNAWTEEIFTRFVIVAGLHGRLPSTTICRVSALVFGLPHYFGTPNGPLGVVMAGLMGWLLARSMIETRSMAWALGIHFLQDLVIFGGGAMVIAA